MDEHGKAAAATHCRSIGYGDDADPIAGQKNFLAKHRRVSPPLGNRFPAAPLC
jgi:hypothetical protein